MRNKVKFQRSVKVKLLMLIISFSIGIVICELFIRINKLWVNFPPEKRTYYVRSVIPGIPYTLKPNIDKIFPPGRIITNKDGFRTQHRPNKNEENVFRILVIGDSITFGFGVSQEHAFPQKLEALLNETTENKHIQYEVINAGVDGYNARDELSVIKYLTPKYHPDIIIWLLVDNDLDDSLSVNDYGQIDATQAHYNASSEWLELGWGWNRSFYDPQNFYQSMKATHQYWAENKLYIPHIFERLDATVKKWLYLYAFLRSRDMLSENVSQETNDKDRVIYKYQRIEHEGKVDFLPKISSIWLSPYYNQRFYTAVNQGVLYATKHAIPIILYGLNIPFDITKLADNVIYEDITQYFGMPYLSFRQKYDLGWDGHFNPKGNRILAESVAQSLVKHNLLTEITIPNRQFYYDKRWYWRQYENYRKVFLDKHIQPYVDFRHFQNIHQLIGGLYPPRTFPIKNGGTLSLILKEQQSEALYILGKNSAQTPQKILVHIGINDHENTINIAPGFFREIVHIQDIVREDNLETIVDVRLNCLTESERKIQISYIGFQEPVATTLDQPLIIEGFGPQEIQQYTPFNIQPNGILAMWFKTHGATPSTVLILNGQRQNTTYNESTLVTAAVSKECYSVKGKYELYLFDFADNRKSNVVYFTVK